jgi:hypothetical protein
MCQLQTLTPETKTICYLIHPPPYRHLRGPLSATIKHHPIRIKKTEDTIRKKLLITLLKTIILVLASELSGTYQKHPSPGYVNYSF